MGTVAAIWHKCWGGDGNWWGYGSIWILFVAGGRSGDGVSSVARWAAFLSSSRQTGILGYREEPKRTSAPEALPQFSLALRYSSFLVRHSTLLFFVGWCRGFPGGCHLEVCYLSFASESTLTDLGQLQKNSCVILGT